MSIMYFINVVPSPHLTLIYVTGEVYANIGQYDEAIQLFKKALKVKPDHIPAHLTMAKVNQKMVSFTLEML